MLDKDPLRHLTSINAQWVPLTYATFTGGAFFLTLLFSLSLHRQDLLENEWFPAINIATGSFFPESSFFQLFTAVATGPRFLVTTIWYLLIKTPESNLPNYLFSLGLFRSFLYIISAFVPSEDDHDLHDMASISYSLLTVIWMGAITFFAQFSHEKPSKYRRGIAQAFVLSFVPLGHYLVQHRLYQVSGAYSKYAFLEWVMAILDLAFDSVSIYEFQGLEFQIFGSKKSVHSSGPSSLDV